MRGTDPGRLPEAFCLFHREDDDRTQVVTAQKKIRAIGSSAWRPGNCRNEMPLTTPGGKVKPPAEGLLLPEPEGCTLEVELDRFDLPPFPLFPFPFPVEPLTG